MTDKPRGWSRKRWTVLLSLLLVAIVGTDFALPYIWLPRGTSTVSLWHAADTFHQCSRQTPKADANSYWLPIGHDIVKAEQELWYMMAERERQGLPVAAKFFPYHRQYIGFKRNGVRLIYINAFLDIDQLEWDDWNEWLDWAVLGKPVSVCDGGSKFWGVVYNPDTQEFEEPQFNSRA